MNPHSGSATLPRGFRYTDHDIPRTPEPLLEQEDEVQIPSPPRPRLKLKRRNVSHHLQAPTQQFLASVAAADVPIPSIEEPEFEPADHLMIGVELPPSLHDQDTDMLHPRGRAFSPPKTPAPGSAPVNFLPALSPKRYPSWTIDSALSSSVESTPDYESSRPSTSRSTQTSDSLFSRLSRVSDYEQCASPDVDDGDKYVLVPNEDVAAAGPANIKGKLRKAPWTKVMSDHLWATYVLYLQDPRVTPFRIGKSCIPPHGVCLRVAREAKRSWRGSKTTTQVARPGDGRKSGSSTPTGDTSNAFIQWPHTAAATRAQLRELCKLKATAGARNRHFISRSPTPFTQAAARHWNRRSTPARSPSVFTTQDISMSLVLSTAESMQPQGPLAQLTSSTPEPPTPVASVAPSSSTLAGQTLSTFEGEPSFAERQRLGSPFGAKSYGPSSSRSLAATLGMSSPMPRRQTHTVGPRRTLQSPVRMSRSGTMKRRNTQSSEPRKRPTIVPDTWLDPGFSNHAPGAEATPATAEFAPLPFTQLNDMFTPRAPAEPVLSSSVSMPNVGGNALLEPALAPPPRLGSPFSASANTSLSFPNRLHRAQPGSVDLGMLGRPRPFATVQEVSESSNAPSSGRTNLAGRLAYIDQRLKELRSRDAARRRSESPL